MDSPLRRVDPLRFALTLLALALALATPPGCTPSSPKGAQSWSGSKSTPRSGPTPWDALGGTLDRMTVLRSELASTETLLSDARLEPQVRADLERERGRLGAEIAQAKDAIASMDRAIADELRAGESALSAGDMAAARGIADRLRSAETRRVSVELFVEQVSKRTALLRLRDLGAEAAALAALDELLRIDPSNAEARALRVKILGYYTKGAPAGFSVVVAQPDPRVVTDAAARERMLATGLPWKIRHNDSGIVMLLCPPGEFIMGSPPTEPGRGSDEAQHRRRIRHSFYLGETEVTQAQLKAVEGSIGGGMYSKAGAQLPVDSTDISLIHNGFLHSIGCGVRLPSEAEWEYACRAGTTTMYSFGDSRKMLGAYEWYYGNSDSTIRAVRQKRPNPWGFYDMHGNAAEWCIDAYMNYPSTEGTEEPQARVVPEGGRAPRLSQDERVVRGGSVRTGELGARSAARRRSYYSSDSRGAGFRVALTP